MFVGRMLRSNGTWKLSALKCLILCIPGSNWFLSNKGTRAEQRAIKHTHSWPKIHKYETLASGKISIDFARPTCFKNLQIHSYWAFSMILTQVQQLKHQVLDMLRSNGQVSHPLPELLQLHCITACLPSSTWKLSALKCLILCIPGSHWFLSNKGTRAEQRAIKHTHSWPKIHKYETLASGKISIDFARPTCFKNLQIHSYWAFSMILTQVQQLKHQVLDMLRSNGQVSHTLPELLQLHCIAACLPCSTWKLSALKCLILCIPGSNWFISKKDTRAEQRAIKHAHSWPKIHEYETLASGKIGIDFARPTCFKNLQNPFILGIFHDSCASAAVEASDEGILSVPSASTAWRTKLADISLS